MSCRKVRQKLTPQQQALCYRSRTCCCCGSVFYIGHARAIRIKGEEIWFDFCDRCGKKGCPPKWIKEYGPAA
jgi:hypothetical protein